MKYDLQKIMANAWKINRKTGLAFSECLHRAWLGAKAEPENKRRIELAAASAGINEEVATWTGWKQRGYEVKHGSKNLFGVDLIYGAKGDGAIYKARFFGRSQVEEIA